MRKLQDLVTMTSDNAFGIKMKLSHGPAVANAQEEGAHWSSRLRELCVSFVSVNPSNGTPLGFLRKRGIGPCHYLAMGPEGHVSCKRRCLNLLNCFK